MTSQYAQRIISRAERHRQKKEKMLTSWVDWAESKDADKTVIAHIKKSEIIMNDNGFPNWPTENASMCLMNDGQIMRDCEHEIRAGFLNTYRIRKHVRMLIHQKQVDPHSYKKIDYAFLLNQIFNHFSEIHEGKYIWRLELRALIEDKKEEITMAQHCSDERCNRKNQERPLIEKRTFYNGQCLDDTNDDNIFALIRSIQNDINDMASMEKISKKAKATVVLMQADLDAVVEYLDAR